MKWIQRLFAPKTPPHPEPRPRFPEPVSAENLRAVFADCGDFSLREVRLGGGGLTAALCSLEGLVDGATVSEDVLRPLTDPERFGGVGDIPAAARLLREGMAHYYSAKELTAMDEVVSLLLEGWCALVFPGLAVAFETKQPKGRSVEKSELEKGVKGAKDSFNELYRVNTALLRQRLRTPDLKLRELKVGRRSGTRVAVAYIQGLTDPRVVSELEKRLSAIDVDALLTTGTLEEYLLPRRSPFPQFSFTERPDRFAQELLNGRAGLLVDGLPLGVLTQGTLAEQLKVTEDKAGHWLTASLLTLLRFAAMLISLLLPALYVAVTVYHQEMIPTRLLLSIIQTKQDVPFSTAAETLGMLLAFELLQEAGLRLPEAVGQTVSIIGALIVGQSAVEAKVLSPIVVIVVAVSGITGYTMPDQDLATALRLCRLLLVLLGLTLGLFGLVLGMALLLWYLCSLESFGTAYLAPFCDGGLKEVLRALLRLPQRLTKERPADLHPRDVRNQR